MGEVKNTTIKKSSSIILVFIITIITFFVVVKIHSFATDGNITMPENSSPNIDNYINSINTEIPCYKESTLPRLHVDGNTIYDEKNREIIFCGFCCGTSTRITMDWPRWYTDETFKTIRSWGVNIFRFTLKPDQYVSHPEYLQLLCNYIDLCVDNNLYVLVSWMGNKDYLDYSSQAASFFSYLSDRYKNCNNIIYEVCNEPFHSSWSTINNYATTITDIIRSNNPYALVAVPTPYHTIEGDDYIDSVLLSPIERENIIYTFHMYVGGSLKDSTLNSLSLLNDNNIPLLISEWGTTLSNGRDGFFEEKSLIWLDYLKNRRIGWINFNLSDVYWKDTPYNSSVAKMGEWNSCLDDNILSPSGFLIKHYILGDYITNE